MAKKSVRGTPSRESAPSEVLSVRLTVNERKIIQREAQARGATLAGFVRTLVMDHIRQPKQSLTVDTHARTGTVGTLRSDLAYEPPTMAAT